MNHREAILTQRVSPPNVRTSTRAVPHILVVDDSEDNRAMYAEFLSFAGYHVLQACNGLEALQLAGSELPNLIVMDMSLPELDGWEATRRLKADAKTQHIPVVALTGHALKGHLLGAKEAGCDAFLAKPCTPEELLATVKELLGGEG